MDRNLEFKVTGPQTIHCESCEQRIGRALKRVPGIEEVRASAQNQLVSVVIDPARIRAEDVKAKFNELGYEVSAGNTV